MTVQELIDALLQQDPTLLVVFANGDTIEVVDTVVRYDKYDSDWDKRVVELL